MYFTGGLHLSYRNIKPIHQMKIKKFRYEQQNYYNYIIHHENKYRIYSLKKPDNENLQGSLLLFSKKIYKKIL